MGTFIKDLINHINYIMYKVCFHYGLYLYVANKYIHIIKVISLMVNLVLFTWIYFWRQKTLIREKEILLQKLVLERIRMNVLDCVCAFGNFSNYHFYLNLVRYFTKIHFFIEYFHFMINETWVKVIFLIQHHACDGQYRINTWKSYE